MFKKVALAALYVGAAYFIYIYGESILLWFQISQNELMIITMVAATLIALFPIIPYPIVGGLIGAAYGPIWGSFVIWFGSSMASILMFLFVRYGYQDWGERALYKYSTVKRVTLLFERNSFLAILFSRMIFIIPSIAINIYSAISQVSFRVYVLASSLGKIPTMLLFAFVGNDIVSDPGNLMITISVYIVFLTVTLLLYRLWLKVGGSKA